MLCVARQMWIHAQTSVAHFVDAGCVASESPFDARRPIRRCIAIIAARSLYNTKNQKAEEVKTRVLV